MACTVTKICKLIFEKLALELGKLCKSQVRMLFIGKYVFKIFVINGFVASKLENYSSYYRSGRWAHIHIIFERYAGSQF